MNPEQQPFLVIAALAFVAASMLSWVALSASAAVLRRYRETFTRTASHRLADIFLFVDPLRLFYLNLAALLVVPLLVWLLTSTALFVALAAGAVAVLPKLAYNHLQRKRWMRFEAQLPDACAALAASLRAGASLTLAMESLVREQQPPLAQEFELLLREQRLGVAFDEALGNMARRIPLQDFQLVAAGMRISREVGGNLADILESLADTLRRKAMMEGKVRALTAQGRMQGVVMAGLPVLLAFVLLQLEPEAMRPLYTTPTGYIVLAVIVVMEVLGYFAIRRITNVDV